MNKLYLVPIETNGLSRGPKYFFWRKDPDPPALVSSGWSMMDYGFMPYALLLAKDIIQADHDALIVNADVYVFPDDLGAGVSDQQTIDDFFEDINIPTDWMTPSTTYLELLRNVAGMFQFNQRYAGIYADRYGGTHSIFDAADLSTRLRQMTDEEQEIFLATVESFGIDPEIISTNSQLRLLVRQGATIWQNTPFYLGGFEF